MTKTQTTVTALVAMPGVAIMPMVCGASLANMAQAEDPVTCPEPGLPATFLKVIDGDTFKMQAHLPLGVHKDITVRLEGIDTYELTGLQATRGKDAKADALDWSKSYPDVIIFLSGNMSFDRHVARVCLPGGGKCLDEVLRKHGKQQP